jgi:hypothetical protein
MAIFLKDDPNLIPDISGHMDNLGKQEKISCLTKTVQRQ